jgi:hypothetical protein
MVVCVSQESPVFFGQALPISSIEGKQPFVTDQLFGSSKIIGDNAKTTPQRVNPFFP